MGETQTHTDTIPGTVKMHFGNCFPRKSCFRARSCVCAEIARSKLARKAERDAAKQNYTKHVKDASKNCRYIQFSCELAAHQSSGSGEKIEIKTNISSSCTKLANKVIKNDCWFNLFLLELHYRMAAARVRVCVYVCSMWCWLGTHLI